MPLSLPIAFPLVSNLQGLAAGAAKGLGHVGTAATVYVDDICSPIFITTGATTPNVNGILTLFIVVGEEILTPSRFTDGINPDSTVTQHTRISIATQINGVQSLGGSDNPLLASTTYCFQGFSVKSILGYTPTFWAPFVWNRLGNSAPLSATLSDFYAVHSVLT